MLSKAKHIIEHELTESALIHLLRCEGKDFKEFNHYFDQYFA